MEDLAHLRRLAQLQRDTAIEHRVRGGEDPAIVTEEVPQTEEILVQMLRDDALDAQGLSAEYALARLAASSQSENAADIENAADEIDARLYREIAFAYPELTRTVWRMLGELSLGS